MAIGYRNAEYTPNGFHHSSETIAAVHSLYRSCLPSYLILNKLDIRQCTLVLISVISFFFSLVLAMRLFHLWHLCRSTGAALCFCRLYVSAKLFADEKCADKMMIIIIPKSHMAPLPFGHITLHQCGLSRRLLCMCVVRYVCAHDRHCEYIFRFSSYFFIIISVAAAAAALVSASFPIFC